MVTASVFTHSTLHLSQIIACLEKKSWELQGSIPITWYHRDTPPADPRQAPEESWPVWDRPHPAMLRPREKNWFHGTVVFPALHRGVALGGSEARIFISGYCPFTLWLDGEEIFAETHSWHASGPIADPVTTTIEPGRPYRLPLCLEPTEIPARMGSLRASTCSRRRAMETADRSRGGGAAIAHCRKAGEDGPRAELVEEAARLIDVQALEEHRWEAVCASIAAMEAALAPFSARAKAHTVHLIGHTHIDMDWMWTWPDTVHCVRRDAKAVTELMRDYPGLTFTHSQVPTYQILREMDPDVFAAVQQYIAEGRWENAAGTWVEGDLNMADGESMARHMRLCGGVDAGAPGDEGARAVGAGYLRASGQYAAVGEARRVRLLFPLALQPGRANTTGRRAYGKAWTARSISRIPPVTAVDCSRISWRGISSTTWIPRCAISCISGG